MGLSALFQLLNPACLEAAVDKYISEWECVPIRPWFWTLTFDFHVIVTHYETLILLICFNHLKIMVTLWAVQKQESGWFGLSWPKPG